MFKKCLKIVYSKLYIIYLHFSSAMGSLWMKFKEKYKGMLFTMTLPDDFGYIIQNQQIIYMF